MGREIPAIGSGVHGYLQLHEFEARLWTMRHSQNQGGRGRPNYNLVSTQCVQDSQGYTREPKKGRVWVGENREQITEIKMNFDAGFPTDG